MSKFLRWRVGLSTRFMDLVVRTPLFKKVVRWLFPNTVLRYLKTMIYRQQLKIIHKQLEKSFQGPPDRSAPFSDALKNPVKKISIRLEGPFSGSDNISVYNRAMAMAMKKMGLDVSTVNSDEEGLPVQLSTQTLADHPFLEETILRYEALSSPDLDLRQQYPPVSRNMVGKINAFHSFGWEESVFPRKFVEEFNTNLDFIGVTSRFVAKTLRDNGVSIPIVVQGLGPTPLFPSEIDNDISDHLKSFVFLHISSCVPMKGIDVLLDAYGMAFSVEDDVTLLIKTFPNIHNSVEELLQNRRTKNTHYPHVLIINEEWASDKLSGLYDLSDWAVFPSRGEGYGMPLADAMVRKLPVITTGYGGQVDFCTIDTALLCDYGYSYSLSHVASEGSLWVEPNTFHLADLMKQAFSMEEADRQFLIQNAYEQVKISGWDVCARKILLASEAIPEYQQKKKFGDSKGDSVAWVSTWNMPCGIATYSENLSRVFRKKNLTILANRIENTVRTDEDFVRRIWEPSRPGLQALINFLDKHHPHSLVVQHNTGLFSVDWLFQLLLQAQKKDINTFIFFHNVKELVGTFKESREYLNVIFKAATRTFVHSLSDLNLLRTIGEINNVTLFPHGIYDRPKNSGVRSSRIESLPVGKRIIATYGFLLPHKGIPELIIAFGQLRMEHPDLHLLLVNALHTNSESIEELRKVCRLISQMGLEDDVTVIHDFLPDSEAFDLLESADLIVYPYQRSGESASGAVKMGLASGRPVAVTPLAIFEDIPEDVAYRLPDISSEGITRGLSSLMEDMGLREELIKNSGEYIRERSWDVLSQRLFSIVEGCHQQKIFEKYFKK